MIKKLFLMIFLILVASSAFIYVFKDSILDRAARFYLSDRLGALVSYDQLKIDIAKSEVVIENLKVGNPPQFPDGVFIDASFMRLIVDRESLFRGRLRFLLLEIDIRNLSVVKNAQGKLNIQSLPIQSRPNQSGTSLSKPPLVETLRLSVATVAYKDYTKGDKPTMQVVEVNLKDRSFEDVPSTSEVVNIVLSQALKDTAWKTAVIYGAATAASVSLLPVGAAVIVAGNDSAKKTAETSLPQAFAAAQAALNELGSVTSHNEGRDHLKASVQGSEVTVALSAKEAAGVEIIVKARKLLIPQPKTAEAVLFQIMENLESVALKQANTKTGS